MECYCYLRNIYDSMADGQKSHQMRYGARFDGPVIPCDVKINCKPLTSKYETRAHPFGEKMLYGILHGPPFFMREVIGQEIC